MSERCRQSWRRGAAASILVAGMVSCSPPADVQSESATAITTAPTQPTPDQPQSGQPVDDQSAAAQPVDGSTPAGALATTLDGVSIAVVGDSLTVSARDQIVEAFAAIGGEVVGFDALDGRKMVDGTTDRPGGLAALQAAVADPTIDPDVWVIALGTNDVGAQAEPDELAADIAALLDAADAPVVWIDVFVGAFTAESAEFGQLVRDAASQRSSVVVGDWFHSALDLDPLVDDQVHLTESGKDEFAALMVDSVRRSEGAA